MAYWLVKQEPSKYSWDDLVRDGHTVWDGVRNYLARNNLNAMRLGDRLFYYHSVEEKQIVGIAQVTKEAFPDASAGEEAATWLAVEIAPLQPLASPLSLAAMKEDDMLKTMEFIRQSRLSVSPVTEAEYKRILELTKTKPAR